MSSAAARVGDPISHTSALDGFLAGLAIGAGVALAGVAIVGTGGLAAVAVVGAAASGGAAIGQMFGSMSTSEAGTITSGSPNVRINGIPAARAHVDHAACSKHSHKEVIAMGSAGVRINGQPAARVDDKTACSGIISSGSGNVRIGGGTVQTDEINPEIPQWLSWTVLGIGIVSTGYFLWVAPVLTMGGIAGGVVGEKAGSAIGGAYFGEGSNEQAMFALGGAVVGGLFGARGAQSFHSRYSISTQGLGSNFGNIKINRRTTGGLEGTSPRVWTKTARIRDAKLPSSGRIRYVPPKNWDGRTPIPRGPNKGYLDKFGNEWTRGPSRTEGQPFEWDVQLSKTGREKIGWITRDGSHANISLDGKVTHK